MPKHTIESDDGSSTYQKKQRMSRDAVFAQKILDMANALIEFIPTIREDIELNHQANPQFLKSVMKWKVACNLANGCLPWAREDLLLLDERLRDDSE
jgi:hypothetical protein